MFSKPAMSLSIWFEERLEYSKAMSPLTDPNVSLEDRADAAGSNCKVPIMVHCTYFDQ